MSSKNTASSDFGCAVWMACYNQTRIRLVQWSTKTSHETCEKEHMKQAEKKITKQLTDRSSLAKVRSSSEYVNV